MSSPLVVRAFWDHEAEVWVAGSAELKNLHTEAESIELLRKNLPGMILDIYEESGDADLPVSIELIAYAHDHLAVA